MGLNMMTTYNSLIFIILFLLFPLFSHGEEFSISNENNHISELRPGQKVTVGFMDITANEDVKIIKIEAEMIERIEAHSMTMDGEIMKMRKITPELVKNKKYKFKPGGNHLMLFGIDRELKAGGDISLLFTFQLNENKKPPFIFTRSFVFKIK
jgi:copper(I)-binding protein